MENIKGFMLPTNDPNVIDEFRGKYFFLSNFFIKPVYYKSEWYRSSEHAFQAQKATNDKDKQYILNTYYSPNGKNSPGQAKHRGNEINCRKNWNEKRMIIMYDILRCKFTDGTISDHNTSRKYPILQLADKLIATGDTLLIEGNSWGDNFWGMVRDPKTGEWKGDNFLGKLLMKVRNEIG